MYAPRKEEPCPSYIPPVPNAAPGTSQMPSKNVLREEEEEAGTTAQAREEVQGFKESEYMTD